jgi:hypothetical protein
VKEHLEHINQRKTQDWENFQPRLTRHISQPHAPRSYTVSLEDPCSDDGWNRVITQTANFGQPVRRVSGLLRVASTGGTGPSHRGSLSGSNALTQKNVPDGVVPGPLQSLIESNKTVVGPCKDMEIEEGDILIGFTDSFEHPKDPPTYCHEEYLDESSPSSHTFDYRDFVDTGVNNSSSLS